MPNDSSAIVSKVWNYAHVLKNAGIGYGNYVEQITYLLIDSGPGPSGCAQTSGLPLCASLRLMAEIDEVIESHGGWPDAFQTDKAAED